MELEMEIEKIITEAKSPALLEDAELDKFSKTIGDLLDRIDSETEKLGPKGKAGYAERAAKLRSARLKMAGLLEDIEDEKQRRKMMPASVSRTATLKAIAGEETRKKYPEKKEKI